MDISHGGRSLVGYSPWSRKESDMTERLKEVRPVKALAFHMEAPSRLWQQEKEWKQNPVG